MLNHTQTRGALSYYLNDNGETISEGYHDLRGQSGERGAGVFSIKPISEPNRDSWEETAQIGTGDWAGYDGTYWYLLDENNTPNSEPYTSINVDQHGDIIGHRNGEEHRISPITRTTPDTLPDGTELEHTGGTRYGIKDGDASGHTVYIHNGILKTQLGATRTDVRPAKTPIDPACSPSNQKSAATTNSPVTPSLQDLTTSSVLSRASQEFRDDRSTTQESNSQKPSSSETEPPDDPRAEIEYWKTQYATGQISINSFESKIETPLQQIVPGQTSEPLDVVESTSTDETVLETA